MIQNVVVEHGQSFCYLLTLLTLAEPLVQVVLETDVVGENMTWKCIMTHEKKKNRRPTLSLTKYYVLVHCVQRPQKLV